MATATILDKTLDNISHLESTFLNIVAILEIVLLCHMCRKLNWGRGVSLCKAINFETVLSCKVVPINEKTFSSSSVLDCRTTFLLNRLK